MMQVWIEGTPDEVIQAANEGWASAIVANPFILERWTEGGKPLEQAVSEVCAATAVPVFVQLHGPDVPTFRREMEALRRISERIQPTLPATTSGLSACHQFAAAGSQPLITGVSTLNQAFLAACAHAACVVPYVSRLLDSTRDGYQLVHEIVDMFDQHEVTTRVAAASIRNPTQAERVLMAGAPVLILTYDVIRQMSESDLSRNWNESFEKSWRKILYAPGK